VFPGAFAASEFEGWPHDMEPEAMLQAFSSPRCWF